MYSIFIDLFKYLQNKQDMWDNQITNMFRMEEREEKITKTSRKNKQIMGGKWCFPIAIT
jgi:hypothetical protein